jgi:hypothetical protein
MRLVVNYWGVTSVVLGLEKFACISGTGCACPDRFPYGRFRTKVIPDNISYNIHFIFRYNKTALKFSPN